MTETWWFWLLLAVLVFWAVGAYNRLVRLRAAALGALGSLDARWQQQIGLVDVALVARDSGEARAIDALRAAAQALSRQWAGVRAQPLAGLDLAELAGSRRALIDCWRQLSLDASDLAGSPWPEAIHQHWQQGISECEMLSRQFNEAVTRYNLAAAEFPAALLARIFGFQPGPLLPD